MLDEGWLRDTWEESMLPECGGGSDSVAVRIDDGDTRELHWVSRHRSNLWGRQLEGF